MSEWIDVNDVLPTKPVKAIVFAVNGQSYTTEIMSISGREPLKNIYKEDTHIGLKTKLFITHWMPLPEPPKTNKRE